MKTAKEKAQELVDTYYSRIEMNVNAAKQCAIITIDEMIDRLTWHTGASDLGNTILVGDIDYWQEVKNQIGKI